MNDQEFEGWVSTQTVERRFEWMTQRPAHATKSSGSDVSGSERNGIGNDSHSTRLAKFARWPVSVMDVWLDHVTADKQNRHHPNQWYQLGRVGKTT